MPARFVLKKGSTGKFRFNLHGTNGQVIASSESYSSKASALKGIEAVKRVAGDAAVVDETPQRGGKAGAATTKDVGKAIKAAEQDEGGTATKAAGTRTAAAKKAAGTTAKAPGTAKKAAGSTKKAASGAAAKASGTAKKARKSASSS